MFDTKVTYEIYSVDGTPKVEVVAEENSIRHAELMKEDYVKLSFTLHNEVFLGMGDYIDTDWGRFEITQLQKPSYDTDTKGYKYDIQFNAPYFKWTNKLYKFEPKINRNEATWSLTDTLANHLAVLKRNLAAYGWKYDTVINNDVTSKDEVIYIQFDNIFIFDAVTKIAEAFDTEWRVSGDKIIFGRVESGESFDLQISDNVEKVSVSDNNKSYVSRLYAFGSTQNIPANYRKDDNQVLLNGVVQKRLMLPAKTPYVDVDGVKTTEDVVEGIVTFDDVYPKMDCQIGELKVITKEVQATSTIEAESKDSSTSTATTDSDAKDTKTVSIYRFKDKSLKFSKDYVLSGQQLQLQFTSGSLKGMFFDLAFNPDGAEDSSDDAQWFEIVINNTYGLDLPNDTLKPKVDDKYILFGWDATKMDKLGLIDDAEKTLLERTQAYAKKLQIDPSTYTCTMLSDWMYGIADDGKQDSSFSKIGSFPIGQRVRMVDKSFFKSGSRESRVIGYEYKLDMPYDHAQIIVGENTSYSYRKDLEASVNEKFDSINYRGGSYTGGGSGTGGGGSLFVLRTNDTINTPTDDNVLSALRTERDFVHSTQDDNISALHTFQSVTGARRGLQTSHYRNALNEDNLFGQGFELVMRQNKNGVMQSRLEVDELLVRVAAYFASLEIRRIAYVGGNYIFTPAGGKIYHVEWLNAAEEVLEQTAANEQYIAKFRCYLYSDDGTTATMNGFKDYDQVLCRTFNIDEGVHENVHNQYYWRLCNAIGKKAITGSDDTTEYQYVDLSNAVGEYLDTLSASGKAICYPNEGDTIVTFGNWKYAERQGVIYFMVEGDLSPAIIQYKDVGANEKHFQLPEMPDIQISPRVGNIFHGQFISVNEVDGYKGMSIDEIFAALLDKIKDIEQQADKKFEMWFLEGTPHPLKGEDYSTANSPASDWSTDAERNLHLQDLYYDTEKDPASDGGRAWRWQSATANNATSWYWEEVTDQDTIEALQKARDLQNQVDDISSDSVLSAGSEKTRLLIEWYSAIANYKKYWEQANDYGLTEDENTSCHSLHEAFFALAKMLNDGEDYSEIDCEKETVPSWIDKDFTVDTYLSGYVTNSNTQGVTISSYSKEQYKANWKEFYNQLAAVLKDIKDAAAAATQKAQDTADDAVKSIEDICNDNILDASEKQTLKRDFVAFWHEMYDSEGLEDKGKDANGSFYTPSIASAFGDIVTSFEAVGTFLNASSKWSSPSALSNDVMPVWLNDENITKASPAIDGKSFVSLWSGMYAKRTAYLTLLSKYAKHTADAAQDAADKAQDTADKKVQTFISRTVPETPYDSGDIWVNTADNNNLLISMQSRLTETGTTYPNDWFDLSTIYDKYDPRMVLSAMAEKVYEISGGSLESRGRIKVYLNSNNLTNGTEGDIALSNNSVYRYSSTWNKMENNSYVDTFNSVYNALGAVTITIYSAIPSTNAIEHDLVLRTISWHDPFKNEDVYGNIEILMYNGSSWEMLRESTKAIIENLGKELRLVVFGSDGKGATDASGLVTRTMFSELFSQKVKDDKVVTESTISTWLGDNDYLTGASIKSWATDEAGFVKSATLDAYVKRVSNGDGTYSLESDIVLSADKINFIGKTIINDKFWVDANGIVYMEEANVSGTINATSGKIGNFKINGGYLGVTDGISNSSNDGMWLTDDEIGFNNNGRQVVVGPFNNLGYDYLGWFNDNDSNSLMSKTGVVIDVSGSIDKNIAIELQGGCISGLAINTQSFGLEQITNSSFQQMYNGVKTNLDNIPVYNTLTKYMNAVLVNTQFSYRAKATDDYTTYSRDRYITLPEMTDADDGHVLMIKRGKGGNSVYVCPGKYKKLVSSSSGYSVTYSTETNDTFMLVNEQQYIADANLKIGSESDAMTLVFFKSLEYTVYDKKYIGGSKTFKGCWVQWKNPRDW